MSEPNVNSKVLDVVVQTGNVSTDAGLHAAGAIEHTSAVIGPLASSTTQMNAIVAELSAMKDVDAVNADRLLAASHELCGQLNGSRDKLIDLFLVVSQALVGNIQARQAAKELHVKLAEIALSKAKAEDVFGAAVTLQGLQGVPFVPRGSGSCNK